MVVPTLRTAFAIDFDDGYKNKDKDLGERRLTTTCVDARTRFSFAAVALGSRTGSTAPHFPEEAGAECTKHAS